MSACVGDLLGLRQSHVHNEDELEGVVEGEPVGGVDGGFEDGEEGVDDPVLVTDASAPMPYLLPRG